MKNYFYLLICSGMFLVSCGSHKKAPEIPFKQIQNDTASKMILKYNGQPPQADTNYREVPRMYGFDIKQLESFTAESDSGKVVEVNFMISAYLDERPVYLKNTVLMQIGREKGGKIYYSFYDLRDPVSNLDVSLKGGLPLCPPPPDCIPPGITPAQ
jgi:hypothetical protein